MNDVHLELIYEGDQCPASYYMAQAVEEVLPLFKKDAIRFSRVEYKKTKAGADRLIELSIALHGEERVRKGLCFAPIPSIFINGQLLYDIIPQRDELIKSLEKYVEPRRKEEKAPARTVVRLRKKKAS